MNLYVQLLSPNAKLPVRGSEGAAGLDLFSADDTVVPTGGRALVRTDIAIAVPTGTYGRIAPRSGLAVRFGIDVGAGVVDEDYRGNVGVVLFNFGSEDYKVQKGDRIAQLILERIERCDPIQVGELPDSTRGNGGFGSTGTR